MHALFPRKRPVAKITGKLLLRLNFLFRRVVTLVVRVQILNAVMVTLTDLTHDVTMSVHLQQIQHRFTKEGKDNY